MLPDQTATSKTHRNNQAASRRAVSRSEWRPVPAIPGAATGFTPYFLLKSTVGGVEICASFATLKVGFGW